MAAVEFSELRSRIRIALQDSDASYWTDDELDGYINEGQLDFVRRTRSLRSQFPIVAKENQMVYDMPEDALEILRIEDDQGIEIDRVTSSFLKRNFGRAFTSVTGSPRYAYSDLDGENKFRFYPRPDPSIEVGSNAFEISRMQYFGIHEPNFRSMEYDYQNELFYVLLNNSVKIYDRRWRLLNTFVHNKGISQGQIRVANGASILGNSAQRGTMFFNDTATAKIHRILPDGTVSDYGTASATVDYLFPIETVSGALLHFYIDTSKIASTVLGSFSEVILSTSISHPLQSAFTRRDKGQFLYYSTTSDLRRIDTALNTDAQVDSASTWEGMAKGAKDVLYGTKANVVQKIDHDSTLSSVVITPLTDLDTIDDVNNRGFLFSDTIRAFAIDGTPGTVVREIEADVELRNYKVNRVPPYEGANDHDGGGVAVAENEIYWFDSSDDLLWYNNFEDGCITDADNGTFDSEEGALSDSTDTDQIIFFENEEGCVRIIHDADDQGTIWFVKRPKIDRIEIQFEKALLYYALHKSFEKEIDQQNFGKATYYLQQYIGVINQEKIKAQDGYLNSGDGTRTYFF